MSEVDNVLLPAKWPSDWHISTVGTQFQIILGKMLDAEKNVGTPKPYLGNRSVQWGQIDVTSLDLIKLTEGDLRKYRLQAGDLLVCEGGDIGRAAIWQDQLEECYFQKALHRLRPRGTYSSVLMRYLLEYYARTGFLANFATQTSIAHLPKDKFVTVPLPLPPLPEQQAIAAALSDADGVVAGLERVIAKKRLIKQGAMQDLLTARRRLPRFSEEWEVVKLGTCASVISKGTTPTSIGHSFTQHGVNFIKVESIVRRTVDLTRVAAISETTHAALKRSQLQAGDVLVSIAGAIGRVGIVDKGVLPANTNQALAFVRLNDRSMLFPGFVPYILESDKVLSHWDEISVQGAQPNISLSDVRNLNLPCPPYMEQQAIAAVLSDMDKEIHTLESRLAKARAVKEGMMQNLLTGRVRLV